MGIDVAAFWLAIAAVIVAAMWRRRHAEALRHETLRVMIEKNSQIDENLLKEVLNPPPADNQWTARPGDAYRAVRFVGSIVMMLSPAVGIVAGMIAAFEVGREAETWAPVGLGIGLVPLIAGFALFVSARFLERPRGDDDQR